MLCRDAVRRTAFSISLLMASFARCGVLRTLPAGWAYTRREGRSSGAYSLGGKLFFFTPLRRSDRVTQYPISRSFADEQRLFNPDMSATGLCVSTHSDRGSVAEVPRVSRGCAETSRESSCRCLLGWTGLLLRMRFAQPTGSAIVSRRLFGSAD